MASIICICDYIHIVYTKDFQGSEAHDIARESYLIFDFVYSINGEFVEHNTVESRQRFAECDPSSLRAFIQGKEPLPLDTIVEPQEAEIIRETVSNAIASLVHDCAGVEGLKMLQVDVLVEINQQEEEEDYGLMELDNAKFLRERRMNLLQKNIYMGAEIAEKDNDFCVICLDEFKEGDEEVCTPCNHWFHDACLGRWFERTDFCPLCRFKIEPF